MKVRKKILTMIVIGLAFILLATSCTSKKATKKPVESDQKVVTKKNEVKQKEEEKKKAEENFKKLIEEEKEPYEIVKFIDENISKFSKTEAMKMIEELEKIQEHYIEIYTEQLLKNDRQAVLMGVSNQNKIDEKKVDSIEDEELKTLISNILKGKYKLMVMEGVFCPVIDYERLKTYNKYLEEEMVDYIDIKSIETNKPSLIDAELIITWDELGKRLITVEKYLKRYSEGIKKEEMLRFYGEYLIMYVEGVDNTPIYDMDTSVVHEDVIASYNKLITENRDSITSDIINKYLNILKKYGNKINKDVRAKIVDLYNEAINRLEETK